MIVRKLSAVLLVSMLFFGTTLAQAADYKTKLTLTVANAGSVYDEAYVLTVPADLSLTGAGWNEVGTINVKHDPEQTTTFDSSKQVVVTAASENGGLVNTEDKTAQIGYTIKSEESDTAAVTTFEFSAEEINAEGGTNKTIGVDVEDYSKAPNGTYEDYIVYTAEVKVAPIVVTWRASDITGGFMSTFSKDGVTLSGTEIYSSEQKIEGGGTFSTGDPNFTKIEITASNNFSNFGGDGWTVVGNKATWTGKSFNVSFYGDINYGGGEDIKFTFTIEPQS